MIDAYPDINSIKLLCKKNIPKFVWDYLDSSTGLENVKQRNLNRLGQVLFKTNILKGDICPDYKVNFDGMNFKFPLGVAPVGMSGLIYPDAEIILANAAVDHGFPYVLSTVSACSIERLAENVEVDENIWFQLYCPRDKNILRDILKRVADAGIRTLVITVDLPGPSVRERQIKSGLTVPPNFNKKIIWDSIMSPRWAIRRLLAGVPKLENLTRYSRDLSSKSSVGHIGYMLRVNPTIDYLKEVRQIWSHRILIKGISSLEHIEDLTDQGFNGLWLSNHAGRQFDGHPSILSQLVSIRQNTDLCLVVDGSIDSALNIIRAIGLGADLVMSGSAWHYSLGAFGRDGPQYFVKLIMRDLVANLTQLGVNNIIECRDMLCFE